MLNTCSRCQQHDSGDVPNTLQGCIPGAALLNNDHTRVNSSACTCGAQDAHTATLCQRDSGRLVTCLLPTCKLLRTCAHESGMKVALLPVAAARASIVLLQPGGPCSSTPRGGDRPRRSKEPVGWGWGWGGCGGEGGGVCAISRT